MTQLNVWVWNSSLARSPFNVLRDTAAVCWGPLLIGPIKLDFPVCIPSAILCAKVPCVVPTWCFPCLSWPVQLGEVPWPYLTCPLTTAIAWSPDGISIHWSGGYRSEDNDADDVFWNPLLRSVNEYVLEPVHLPDFLSIHLLFGRAEVQGSPCTSFLVNRLLSLAQMMDHVLMWTPKFSSQKIVRFGFLLACTNVVKCQRMITHVEKTWKNTWKQ